LAGRFEFGIPTNFIAAIATLEKLTDQRLAELRTADRTCRATSSACRSAARQTLVGQLFERGAGRDEVGGVPTEAGRPTGLQASLVEKADVEQVDSCRIQHLASGQQLRGRPPSADQDIK